MACVTGIVVWTHSKLSPLVKSRAKYAGRFFRVSTSYGALRAVSGPLSPAMSVA